jgi:Cytidylate kinase-like family
MSGTIASERCVEFVKAQARVMRQAHRRPSRDGDVRVITISRQAGSGAHAVADALVDQLRAGTSDTAVPWKVFDRDLVEKVIHEHDLPERMAEFMPEDRISAIADTLDELFGLHPSSWSLVRRTADTILHLAELGNVIIIGRAGSIITRHISGAFHVRLVGSKETRIAHVMDYHELNRDDAMEYVRHHDIGRKRYVKTYYSCDIDDPLLYHLVMNTDRLGYDETARLIADAVHREVTPPGPRRTSGRTMRTPLRVGVPTD